MLSNLLSTYFLMSLTINMIKQFTSMMEKACEHIWNQLPWKGAESQALGTFPTPSARWHSFLALRASGFWMSSSVVSQLLGILTNFKGHLLQTPIKSNNFFCSILYNGCPVPAWRPVVTEGKTWGQGKKIFRNLEAWLLKEENNSESAKERGNLDIRKL